MGIRTIMITATQSADGCGDARERAWTIFWPRAKPKDKMT